MNYLFIAQSEVFAWGLVPKILTRLGGGFALKTSLDYVYE